MSTKRPNRPGDEAATTGDTLGEVSPLLIDDLLPEYDAVSRRHVVVDSPADRVYEAMLTADLTRLGPVVNTLGALRALPGRVRTWFGGEPTPEADAVSFGAIPTRGSWVRLAERTDREFVFGAIGKVWRPDIEWVDLSADEFRTFSQPGYAKIAAGFSLQPYGNSRTLLTYEARTSGTDDAAARRFRRYWFLVRPFVSYILWRVLVRIKRDAEAG